MQEAAERGSHQPTHAIPAISAILAILAVFLAAWAGWMQGCSPQGCVCVRYSWQQWGERPREG